MPRTCIIFNFAAFGSLKADAQIKIRRSRGVLLNGQSTCFVRMLYASKPTTCIEVRLPSMHEHLPPQPSWCGP
eukprot:scaffold180401_cov18-Tisochrysis_lutea.AAC.4